MRRIRSLWLLAFAILALVLLAMHGRTLWSAVPPWSQWRYDRVAWSALLQILVWLTLALAWVRLLAGAASGRIQLGQALMHQSLVALGKYVPGKIWGMVARGGLLNRAGMSGERIVEVSLLEQLLVMHSAAVAALLAGSLFLFARQQHWLGSLALALCVLSVPVARMLALPVTVWIARRIGRNTAMAPRRSGATGDYLRWLAWYVLAWLLFGVLGATVSGALLPAFSLDLPSVLWFVVAIAVSTTLGFLALFAPAGIGVRDGALGWMLAMIMTPVEAAIAVVAVRLWSVLADGLLGLLPVVLRRT